MKYLEFYGNIYKVISDLENAIIVIEGVDLLNNKNYKKKIIKPAIVKEIDEQEFYIRLALCNNAKDIINRLIKINKMFDIKFERKKLFEIITKNGFDFELKKINSIQSLLLIKNISTDEEYSAELISNINFIIEDNTEEIYKKKSIELALACYKKIYGVEKKTSFNTTQIYYSSEEDIEIFVMVNIDKKIIEYYMNNILIHIITFDSYKNLYENICNFKIDKYFIFKKVLDTISSGELILSNNIYLKKYIYKNLIKNIKNKLQLENLLNENEFDLKEKNKSNYTEIKEIKKNVLDNINVIIDEILLN